MTRSGDRAPRFFYRQDPCGYRQNTLWGLRVSKNAEKLFNGKEESYERNPGGVPFVFNHKFFGTSERF